MISNGGGMQPRWRRDGKEIVYLGLDGRLMSVEVTATANAGSPGAIQPGVPKPLFAMPASGTISTHEYQVARDGRFLIATPIEEWGAGPITVVVDWPAALKKN